MSDLQNLTEQIVGLKVAVASLKSTVDASAERTRRIEDYIVRQNGAVDTLDRRVAVVEGRVAGSERGLVGNIWQVLLVILAALLGGVAGGRLPI